MSVKKFIWSVAIKESCKVDPHALFSVFNKWIPESPEIFIDVADYQHVSEGPVILLVGHHVDYILENKQGRSFFVAKHKRQNESDQAALVLSSLKDFKNRLSSLKNEEPFKNLELNWNDLFFVVNDRSITNLDQIKESTQNAVTQVLGKCTQTTFDDGSGRPGWHFQKI